MPFAFKPSGELVPPTPEELAQADAESAILCYTEGTLEDGQPFYVYLAVRPSRYKEFKEITDAGEGFAFEDFGAVVAFGYEAKAPRAVVREMKEKYGFDEQFKEKLVEHIRKEQTDFLEKQEKQRLDDIVNMLKKKSDGQPG